MTDRSLWSYAEIAAHIRVRTDTVRSYRKHGHLPPPDLVESDFSAAGLQYARNDKGQMLSLPWSVDYFILYYNKDMFAQKGVKVPQTLDEMLVAAEKLTDEKAGIYGYVGRGLRNANMTLWTNYFLNYGGEFLDAKGNILTDGPEAIEATKYYQRISTKLAPPGLAGFNWMESLAAFAQGRAAMWIDGVGWAPGVEDPNASRIAGKVGYAMVPAGPKGQYSATYGDGIGIAAASVGSAVTTLYGGMKPVTGTNPMAFGIPARAGTTRNRRHVPFQEYPIAHQGLGRGRHFAHVRLAARVALRDRLPRIPGLLPLRLRARKRNEAALERTEAVFEKAAIEQVPAGIGGDRNLHEHVADAAEVVAIGVDLRDQISVTRRRLLRRIDRDDAGGVFRTIVFAVILHVQRIVQGEEAHRRVGS